MGRQTDFTPELADEICDRLMDGESLIRICRDENMPHRRTVIRWMEKDPEFATRCARARVEQGDAVAEEITEVLEAVKSGDIPADVGRVVVSGLQWKAAKLAPKVYGDVARHEHSGPDGKDIPVSLKAQEMTENELARRAAFMLERAYERSLKAEEGK